MNKEKGEMTGYMGILMGRRINGWMNESADVWMDGIDRWMDGLTDGWMDEWMHSWMDGSNR